MEKTAVPGSTFIEDYTKLLYDYNDAPNVFNQASAYHLTSTLLGRFFKIPWVSLGGRPNVWLIISSIPGRMRRSSIQKVDRYIYEKVLTKYFSSVKNIPEEVPDEDKSKISAKEMVYSTIIEEGTPEGIIDHISNNPSLNEFDIQSTEFGGVLQRMRSREYEIGAASILSKLYYGEGSSMYLSRRGRGGFGQRYLRAGLYATMFCGMQEPKYYMSPEMIRTGLVRRCLISFFKVREIDRWKEPLNTTRNYIYHDLDVFVEDLTKRMIKYHGQSYNVYFYPQVMDKINAFAYECDKKLEEEESDVNIYKQSFWEHLTKLSALEAIARGNVILVRDEFVINVEEEDFRKAKTFLDDVMKRSVEVIYSLSEYRQPIKIAKDPIERVYSIIASAGEEGMSKTNLYRETNMISSELYEIIGTLLQQERIEKIEEQKGVGRPKIIYKALK